jgi:pilus assembly protein CpaE
MALLTALILTDDEAFRSQTGEVLRSGTLPVTIVDERPASSGFQPDLILVDGRDEAQALAAIERVRAGAPAVSIFMIARSATPDLILQSMRAGANEFLTWPPADAAFQEAIARAAARRTSLSPARPRATTAAFLGAKGGAGTTTVAVNSAVEMTRLSRRPTVIVDLKAGMGEVTLFLGVRGRYTVFDAIENLHRLDAEFLRELVVKHKSGLEILPGSDHFERPASSDSPAVEQILRLLTQQYEQVVVDAGNQLNGSSIAALYMADTIYLVTNPDVPSVRNAQRLLDRIGQLGACADRVRVLLNRASEPYPIAPDQIEGALGRPIHHMFRSDYRTVSTALNSGVPLSMTGNTELSAEFDAFTRGMLELPVEGPESGRRGGLGLQRLASVW